MSWSSIGFCASLPSCIHARLDNRVGVRVCTFRASASVGDYRQALERALAGLRKYLLEFAVATTLSAARHRCRKDGRQLAIRGGDAERVNLLCASVGAWPHERREPAASRRATMRQSMPATSSQVTLGSGTAAAVKSSLPLSRLKFPDTPLKLKSLVPKPTRLPKWINP